MSPKSISLQFAAHDPAASDKRYCVNCGIRLLQRPRNANTASSLAKVDGEVVASEGH